MPERLLCYEEDSRDFSLLCYFQSSPSRRPRFVMVSRPPVDRYSERLVLRLNELLHDHADEFYGDLHLTHLGVEGDRWRRFAETFLPRSPFVLADIGTGMGMVPLAIRGMLTADDRVLAADISTGMLEAARRNIAAADFPCPVEYVKLDAATPLVLPFDDESIGVLTMNSVLHHIRNTEEFMQEIHRVLRPGGVVAIGHEPNAAFRENRFLWMTYQLIYALHSPRYALKSPLAIRTGIAWVARTIYYRLRPERGRAARQLLESLSARLMEEGLLDRPIRPEEIGTIADIRDDVGFHPRKLLPGYEVIQFETYNHVGQVSIDRADGTIISAYDSWLRRRLPESGMTFFASLRKPL